MKKTILTTLAMLLGIAIGLFLAAIIHCNFMLIEVEGTSMIPSVSPGQKVLLRLQNVVSEKNIKVGDIVAYELPYYSVDGENGIVLRRVESISNESTFVLVCDAEVTYNKSITVSEDDIIGTAILF